MRELEQNEKLNYGIQILGSKLASPNPQSNGEIMNEIVAVGGGEISKSARKRIQDLLDRNSVKAGVYVFASLKKANGNKTLWSYQNWINVTFHKAFSEEDQIALLYRECEALVRENIPYLHID